MRYAIFSDIQGNRPAWEAVVGDMRRQQLETTICLGDVVGCGPSPLEVLRNVREESDSLIMGDCDAAVAGLLDGRNLDAETSQAIGWTRSRLDQESLDFLATMAPAIKTEQLLFTHAEALEVSRFESIDSVEKARANFTPSEHHVTFVGHGYRPTVFVLNEDGTVVELPAQDYRLLKNKRYIVNVGSVGIPPAAGDFRARYATYDSDTQELRFRPVPVPVEACQNDWSAAGLALPSWLSERTGEPPPDQLQPGEEYPASAVSRHDLPVAAAPMPEPQPPSSSRSKWPLVALLSGVIVLAIAAFVGVGVLVVWHLQGGDFAPATIADNVEDPVTEPTTPDALEPTETTKAEDDADPNGMTVTNPPAVAPPVPEHDPEPPTVAVVPEPAPKPAPAPEPDPVPAPAPPPSGPPPIPPEPENAAAATPLSLGLVFYTPLDEPEDEFTARDLAGERDLDVAGGLPGALGLVGFACSLEKQNSSDALISEVKPLSPMKAITMSFWIRRPDPADGDITDGKPVPAEPPMNLVSLKDYCDVRLENNQVVANMDRTGEVARVAFPPDFAWHHVLVENGGDKTTIWIDHRSQSNIVGEKLAPPPKAGVAIQIGSKGAHFHVDEVAIWNRLFTLDERQILYRHGRLDNPVITPPKLVAHWKFDDKSLSRVFADTTGDHPLGAFKSWFALPRIAPDPVQLTEQSNPQAAQVWQLSERPGDTGSFQMNSETAFTYEGWMKLGTDSVVLLGGVPPESGEESRGGWRLEARPVKGVTGDLLFTYQNGPVTVEASAKDIPIYFGRPHHFAAVWNPLANPGHGTMELHLDNKVIATATLPLSDVGTPSDAPFRIIATKTPVVLDEVRFTLGALKPAEFLTTGLDPPKNVALAATPDGPPKDETPMERRARESLERKEKADAKREARLREEEAKRNRSRP